MSSDTFFNYTLAAFHVDSSVTPEMLAFVSSQGAQTVPHAPSAFAARALQTAI